MVRISFTSKDSITKELKLPRCRSIIRDGCNLLDLRSEGYDPDATTTLPPPTLPERPIIPPTQPNPSRGKPPGRPPTRTVPPPAPTDPSRERPHSPITVPFPTIPI